MFLRCLRPGLVAVLLSVFSCLASAGNGGPSAKVIRLNAGEKPTTVNGVVAGYAHVDYHVRAGAGQLLKVVLKGSNGANQFNLLPPGSSGEAMFIGGHADHSFSGYLPGDGTYVIRVYLMRSAARRSEQSRFSLRVEVSGKPLLLLPSGVDARIAGTPYHAQATIACQSPYSEARRCDASVIRRGHDGTATVDVRWDNAGKRTILFVAGKPVATDAVQAFTYDRTDRGVYVMTFEGGERFDIPDALLTGG